MAIQWTEDLSVGVGEIDIQHQVLIGTINELFEVIEHENADNLIPIVLEKLKGYAKFHFGTEEGYFIRFKYELAEDHVAEHLRIVGKIDDFISRHKSGSNISVGELVFFLSDWMANHLKEMDQLYVPCFLKNGLK